jgi:hypothetical protein
VELCGPPDPAFSSCLFFVHSLYGSGTFLFQLQVWRWCLSCCMEGRPGRSCWQQEFQVRLRQAIVEKWMCLKWVQMGSMHREFNP